jgi:hypothetical protein
MNGIGGFFELELNRNRDYHKDALCFNLGRTAFEYVLKAKCIKKIFLPYYTCDVMLEPLKRAGIETLFYHVDEKLEPVFDFSKIGKHDYFLYINYFGIKDSYIACLKNIIINLIIDNSQAFFSTPVSGIDTFYSPRKFFGVPDGGYLYTNKILSEEFENDISLYRFGHLLGRIEDGDEKSYGLYTENEKNFSRQPIKKMSHITRKLLQNIDYKIVKERRRRNFDILQNALAAKNLMVTNLMDGQAPMVYPYVSLREDLHGKLVDRSIYVAKYWNDVLNHVKNDSIEYMFVKCLVPLPIDQRYGEHEMKFIVKNVLKYV